MSALHSKTKVGWVSGWHVTVMKLLEKGHFETMIPARLLVKEGSQGLSDTGQSGRALLMHGQ